MFLINRLLSITSFFVLLGFLPTLSNANSIELRGFGFNKGFGTVGDVYYYKNKHTANKDIEYFQLKETKNRKVTSFPTNQTSNRYWRYIGNHLGSENRIQPKVTVRAWGYNNRKGRVTDIYFYNNRRTKDTEYFQLLKLSKKGLVNSFPTNKISNKFWLYLGDNMPQIIKPNGFGLIEILSRSSSQKQCLEATGSVIKKTTCNSLNTMQWWEILSDNKLRNFKTSKCISINTSTKQVSLESCANLATHKNKFVFSSDYQVKTENSTNSLCLSSEVKGSNKLFATRVCSILTLKTFYKESFNSSVSIINSASKSGQSYELPFIENVGDTSVVLKPDPNSQKSLTVNATNNINAVWRDGTKICHNTKAEPFIPSSLDNAFLHIKFKMRCNNKTFISSFIHISLDSLNAGSNNFFTVSYDKTKAFINGVIGTGTFNQTINFIRNYKSVKTLVFEDAPGSNDDNTVRQMGRFLRAVKYDTYVPANGIAASGAVDLFLSGINRTVHPSGRLGVHSWGGPNGSATDFANNHPVHTPYIEYSNEMLGSNFGRGFYFFTINAARPSSIHNMTIEEMLRWNVITGGVSP